MNSASECSQGAVFLNVAEVFQALNPRNVGSMLPSCMTFKTSEFCLQSTFLFRPIVEAFQSLSH